jgi:hypothetical protein
VRKRNSQAFGNTFDVDKRNVSDPSLYSAVVCAMQSASLRGFFLIDPLFFSNPADGPAKSDANVKGHSVLCSGYAADAYTAYESQSL